MTSIKWALLSPYSIYVHRCRKTFLKPCDCLTVSLLWFMLWSIVGWSLESTRQSARTIWSFACPFRTSCIARELLYDHFLTCSLTHSRQSSDINMLMQCFNFAHFLPIVHSAYKCSSSPIPFYSTQSHLLRNLTARVWLYEYKHWIWSTMSMNSTNHLGNCRFGPQWMCDIFLTSPSEKVPGSIMKKIQKSGLFWGKCLLLPGVKINHFLIKPVI